MINKKMLIGMFSFALICGGIQAQEKVHVKRSEFLIQGERGGDALQKIRKADRLANKGIGFSKEALTNYLEAEKYNGENAELHYNIGVCYLISGPRKNAFEHLKKAYDLKQDVSKDIHFLLGVARQSRYEFAEAIVEFKSNIELLQNKKSRRLSRKDQEFLKLCDKHIAECQSGQGFYQEEEEIVLQNLTGAVNSEFDDFSPFVYSDDVLLFSSRRGSQNWTRRSPIDGKFYERVYMVDRKGDNFYNLQLHEKALNKGRNAAVRGMISKNQMVVYRGKRRFGDLYLVKKGKKGWKTGARISGINKSKAHDASASLTKDGNTMYFVSDRKGGQGKHDIYVSVRKGKASWSKPQNLGATINTPYEEGDVFVTADGSALYFSSKGHNTMGGYDIFKAEKKENGQWGKPVNLGYPINSVSDDINYTQTSDGKIFFFASERDGGNGGYDLYQYIEPEVIEEPKQEIAKEEPVEKEPVAPIVMDEEPVQEEVVVEDFLYKVQIAAARKELSVDELHERYKGQRVIEHLFVGGWHRYTIGNVKSFEEAELMRDQTGVADAFIVLFKGEHRLGLARKNKLNQIDSETVDKETDQEMFYRVQILASNRELSEAEIRNLDIGSDVVEHHLIEGLNCYTIGKFKKYEDALKLKKSCRIDSAFVVLFKGKSRIQIAKKK
ncbi:MAG: hypothetical protein ACEPOZ_02110 [Marinifilaceae bacterium]